MTGQLVSLVGAVMSEQAASTTEAMTVAARRRRRRIMGSSWQKGIRVGDALLPLNV
jgi:hypothetical protein